MEINQSVKILYVDDNEVNQIYVRKVLSRINVQVESVYSGEACLDYLETHNDIILVLLDIQMPGIDGFETAKQIKQIKKEDYLPIIFISGIYNTEEFINMGFDIGAIDFIVKPISRSILKYKILAYVTIHLQNNLLKTQAEELEKNKAYLEKVLELIPYEIFKIDHNRIVTDLKSGGIVDFKYSEILRSINLDIESCFMNSVQCQQETSIYHNAKYHYYDTNILKLVIPNELNSVIVTLNDVTERKEREISIRQLNRKNQILSEINFALLVAQDKQELFFAFSETLKNVAEYNTIWIGDFEQYNSENDFKINTLSIIGDLNKEDIDHLLDNSHHGEFIEHLDKLALSKSLQLIENLQDCEIDSPLFKKKNINTALSLNIETEVEKNYTILLFSENTIFNENEIELLADVSKLLTFGLNALFNKQESLNASQRISFEKEELSITVKNIHEGVITIRQGGIITVANSAAEKIFDYENNELIGKNIFEVTKVLELDGSEMLFNPFDIIQNSEDLSNVQNQLTILTNKNQKKIITVNISLIPNEKGSMNDVVIVFNDVTEKIRIENQLALSQKMESVGQLAAGIAHEINSPMQFVGDNTYFLKDAFDNLINFINSVNETIEDNSEFENLKSQISDFKEEFDIEYLLNEIPISIDRTQTGIDRVSKIVLAMKNFAHPSGKQKMYSNINHGIEVTITISKNEWKYVSDLETEFDENLPNVLCIIDEINQVILNMIINSAHSIEDKLGKNPSDKGKIHISTIKVDNNRVQIKIKDTGKGISKENMARIFDPFFTTKPVGRGTGQGLAIAHDIIVNKHNGSIEVESEIGLGAEFTIILPIS